MYNISFALIYTQLLFLLTVFADENEDENEDEKTLTPDDAIGVLEEILPARDKSYNLGLKLNLPLECVDEIHRRHESGGDRLLHVLIDFTKKIDPTPTWKVIANALRNPTVGHERLANIVEAAHLPGANTDSKPDDDDLKKLHPGS